MSRLIGFITDTEGNYAYWRHCVDLSRVVCFGEGEGSCSRLRFARPDHDDFFVFGGDVFDKGPGDIRISRELLAFREAHPHRVVLLAGNRDLNKLRLTAELRQTEVDVPQPVPVYPRAPPQVSFRAFLEKRCAQGYCSTVDEANTVANRLRWILDRTMTAEGAFELRRAELTELAGREMTTAPTEEDVVQSFLGSVDSDDGFVHRYLRHSQLAAIVGTTLFVHGGVPFDALGWVPDLSMRYRTPQEGEACGGSYLPAGHTVQQWVDALNQKFQEGLQDHMAQTTWRSDESRGGEMLMAMTSTPACFSRSVVVESLLQAGMPTERDARVEEYLGRSVTRVICGHKPCGDSPFVVRWPRLEFVHADTTYSDSTTPDSRGCAVAAVEVEEELDHQQGRRSSRTCLRGLLRDGASYNFALPAHGDGCDLVDSSGSSVPADDCVGQQTTDGWWVKARLADGSYHVATSQPGDRNVRYKRSSRSEVNGLSQLE